MSLKDEADKIEQSFKKTKTWLSDRLEQISSDISTYTAEYVEASAHGDRSENAAFEEAVKALQRSKIDYAEIKEKLGLANKVEDLELYKPIGIIVLYTTVRLTCLDTGVEYIYRLFPAKISDLENTILAEDSAIGKALISKTEGEVIKTMHLEKGVEYSYRIDEIY